MKNLRELQTTLPWSIRYSRDHRACPKPHKDFMHALLHVGKANGKLLGLCDDMDHDREVADDPGLRERHAKYLADLVICALRAANTFPGGVIDLQSAVEDRIRQKNEPEKQTISFVAEGRICTHCQAPTTYSEGKEWCRNTVCPMVEIIR